MTLREKRITTLLRKLLARYREDGREPLSWVDEEGNQIIFGDYFALRMNEMHETKTAPCTNEGLKERVSTLFNSTIVPVGKPQEVVREQGVDKHCTVGGRTYNADWVRRISEILGGKVQFLQPDDKEFSQPLFIIGTHGRAVLMNIRP